MYAIIVAMELGPDNIRQLWSIFKVNERKS